MTMTTTERRSARQAAQKRIEREIASGQRCPDCASTETESNGSSEYRCRECDHRWGFEGGRTGEPYGFS